MPADPWTATGLWRATLQTDPGETSAGFPSCKSLLPPCPNGSVLQKRPKTQNNGRKLLCVKLRKNAHHRLGLLLIQRLSHERTLRPRISKETGLNPPWLWVLYPTDRFPRRGLFPESRRCWEDLERAHTARKPLLSNTQTHLKQENLGTDRNRLSFKTNFLMLFTMKSQHRARFLWNASCKRGYFLQWRRNSWPRTSLPCFQIEPLSTCQSGAGVFSSWWLTGFLIEDHAEREAKPLWGQCSHWANSSQRMDAGKT